MNGLKLFISLLLIILFPGLFSQSLNTTLDTIKTPDLKLYHFQKEAETTSISDNNIKLYLLYPSIPRKKYDLNNTIFFFLLILFFLIIVLIKVINPDYFASIFIQTLNSDALIDNIFKRELRSVILVNNTLLDLIFVITLSMFLLKFNISENQNNFFSVIQIVVILYFIQIVITTIFYPVFFKRETPNVHLSQILVFNRAFGIILVPSLLLINYSYEPVNQLTYILLKYFLIFIILYRIIKNFIVIQRINGANLFYVLLYLCVFELSLYFVIIKEFFGLNHN